MGHTIATSLYSSRETRKNRKKKLTDRIKNTVKRLQCDNSDFVLSCITPDIKELVEIGRIEGYLEGIKKGNPKAPF